MGVRKARTLGSPGSNEQIGRHMQDRLECTSFTQQPPAKGRS